MRLNIAIFFGALFGALGVLLFLVAFGSDYWLLATEVGKCSGEQNIENVTFHHEGFFWRCWFNGIVGENDSNIWQFWYTNQPPWKNCTHAYLSPYPFLRGEHNSTSYDSAVSVLFSLVMMLYVIWVQAVADMESYRHVKMRYCSEFSPSVLYGWSFFLAPAGIFFSLLAGLLFLLVGRHIQIHH
ncbi:transmembrane protein 182 isoform X2 [Cervus elaphus]|uniref:transmembrane protein 182 isoform X2 n=1 Tax=Cervus canadensis TaxID=1574408 RepID=UPI001C9E4B74|nr:transmembrane protein 182 isoform X2 [Cervus canadensis]XP_043774430.1 transmembrane protein 182 isoform X2 [Cervus elaphus]